MRCCRSVVKANSRDRGEAAEGVLQRLHALLNTAIRQEPGR
jgi:hypothetical protein